MKKFLVILMAVLAIIGTCALVSCGNNSAVEEYVEKFAQTAEIDDEMMSVKVSAKGSSVVFDCTLKTAESITPSYEDIAYEMIDSNEGVLEEMQKECPEVKSVIYNFYTNSGEVIVTREFK